MPADEFIPHVTGGTVGTESVNGSRPSMYPDTVLDALLDSSATANRIGRANQHTLWRIENTMVLVVVLLGVLIYRGIAD